MIKVGGVYSISDVVKTDRFRLPLSPFTRLAYSHIEDVTGPGIKDITQNRMSGDPYQTDPIRVMVIRDDPALITDQCNAEIESMIDRFTGSFPYIAWYASDDTFLGYSYLIGFEPYSEVIDKSTNGDIAYGRASIGAKSVGGSFSAKLEPDLPVDVTSPSWNDLYPLKVADDSNIVAARTKVVAYGYIITEPGRTDSDGTVQRDPTNDSNATAVNYPVLTKHKGSARVLSIEYKSQDILDSLPKVNQFRDGMAVSLGGFHGSSSVNVPSSSSVKSKITGVYSKKIVKLRINKMDNDVLLSRSRFMLRGEIFNIESVDSFNPTGQIELTASRDLPL